MPSSIEPIAIIGMGCRLPGSADSPDRLWDNLVKGKNAVGVIPRERFNLKAHYHPRAGARRRTYSKWAGLIDDFDRFDAGFFRISPREASYIDPQHRYLLESAWRALEDAGRPLDMIGGEPVGVFVGISTVDYNVIQTQQNVYEPVGIYSTTGAVHSIAANRISYVFNLKGPSLAVDTACSSSLMAIHQACQSLRKGECETALAGGVNAILGPSVFVCFSRMGMLSARGRCYAFDARADGFVRGEGAGMLLLKPLEKALADGDRIHAVIRGTGTNQDGRTNGITVPSREAQQELTRATCAAVGIDPSQIAYAEAHGTGTPVGDPIEAHALGAVLGKNRSAKHPCLIGSIKTNIGHLEAGSGVAGMIKAALILKTRQIPPSLNYRKPNPNIDFEGLHLKVVTDNTPLPETDGPPMVLVNSFGFGGANANALLQAPPLPGVARRVKSKSGPGVKKSGRPVLLPITANATESFPLRARVLREAMEKETERDLRDWAWAAARGQTHFINRQVLIADSSEAMRDRLTDLENSRAHPDIIEGAVSLTDRSTRPVWVFSGQGPQWHAMGCELLKVEPVFCRVVESCDRIMSRWADWSLLEEMRKSEKDSRIGNTAIAQPAIFALQAGLADLLKSWGLEPGAVVGHSVGEAAAAYASGVLSLEEACRVIFYRGEAMHATPQRGRMLVVGLPEGNVGTWLAEYGGAIDLAAVNSPGSVTLSGDAGALESLAVELKREQIFHQFLKVNYAFHSHQMAEALDYFQKRVQKVDLGNGEVPLYSSVSGKRADTGDFGLEYWLRNIRQPVRFAGVIQTLIGEGHRHFFEIGPHPVLASSIQECLKEREQNGVVVASLRRQEPEVRQLLKACAEWFSRGFEPDWETLLETGATNATLPPYPWKKSLYWHEPEEHYRNRVAEPEHHWLHSRLQEQHPVWQTILDRDTTESIRDHIIQKNTVFPASAYIETALEAGQLLYPDQKVVIEDISLTKALFLPEKASLRYQFAYQPETSDFRIHTLDMKAPGEWSLHCQGKMRVIGQQKDTGFIDLTKWKRRARTRHDGLQAYKSMGIFGFNYGPDYRGMKEIYRGDDFSLVSIEINPEMAGQFDDFVLHPCLLDQVFQSCIVTGPEEWMAQMNEGHLPVGCGRVRLHHRPQGRHFFVTSERTYAGGNVCRFRMTLADVKGRVLADIEDFETRSALKTEHSRAIQQGSWLYHNNWEAAEINKGRSLEATAVLPDDLSRPDAFGERKALARALNRMAKGYLRQTFAEMGLKLDEKGNLRSATLHRKFKKNSPVARRVADFLDSLSLEGREVTRTWQGWNLGAENPGDPDALWERTLRHYPRAYPELLLLRRCADQLSARLSGKINWTQWLKTPENLTLLEHLDRDSISWQSEKETLGRALADWLRSRKTPSPGTLQLLHCQGGTGGLATHILDHATDVGIDYWFIEEQEEKLALAEKHFFDYPQLKTLQVRAGAPLNGKELKKNHFDVLLLENPKPDSLLRLLRWSRRLLKPEGTLFLVGARQVPFWMRLIHEPAIPPVTAAGWEVDVRQAGLVDFSASKWTGACLSVASARHPGKNREEKLGLSLADFSASAPRCVLLFTDRGGTCKRLQSQLEAKMAEGFSPQDVDFIQIIPGKAFRKVNDFTFEIRHHRKTDLQSTLRELSCRYDIGRSSVLYGWPMDLPESLTADSLEKFADRTLVPLLNFAQVFGAEPELAPPSFQIFTRGAAVVGERDVHLHPAGALITGFFRSWIMEIGSMRARLIDLEQETQPRDIPLLAETVLSEEPESEVALRQGRAYYLRIEQAALARPSASKKARGGFRLEVTSPGMMDSLAFLETGRVAPPAGHVEVEVKAAALNFRDVLKIMDLYPSDLDRDRLIGDECAGVVTRVGRGVRTLKPGDEVILTAAGCFSSHLTVPEEAVIPKPEFLTFAGAATMPVAFMTAHYALHRLGHLQKGESVLIQAGTGGVGLAAIQVARGAGATVYATAGDPGKRSFLKYLGVAGVFDSRSVSFEEEVRKATGGRGVDLVLNSLAGQAIEKGISCLAPFGRFLEIGKRDIYANTPVGLRPFRNNISMHVIDLGVFLQEGGASYRSLMEEVQDNFLRGDYRPLPHRCFPMSRAKEALRTLSQARHMGKIVLVHDGRPVPAAPRPNPTFDKISPQGAYVVTGGMRGFGLETVRWLCRHGAGHVYAIGRQVRQDGEIEQLMAYASQRGVVCHFLSVDITRPEEVHALFDRIRRTGVPLRGIIHSAVVLDDGLVQEQSAERLHRVLAPKVAGAWNLHEASQDHRLDFFVMYSSVVALLGNVGQTNYAAANTFLDALSHFRHGMGLPSLTVNWGQLGEVGVVARDEKLAASLSKRGFTALQPESAFRHLECLLANHHVQTGVVPVDWSRFFQTFAASRSRPYFRNIASTTSAAAAPGAGSLRDLVLAEPPEQRQQKMIRVLQEEIASVLRSSAARLSPTRSLTQLGLDSLMTFELIVRLENAFELALPTGRLKADTTLEELAQFMMEILGDDDEKSGGDSSGRQAVAVGEARAEAESGTSGALPEACRILMRPGRNRPPLVVIHPTGGRVDAYRPIIRALPASLPVVAIQSRVWVGQKSEFATMAEMASAYAEAVRKASADQPIRLLGYSNGGYFALATARAIEEGGGRVEWLGLIDCLSTALDPHPAGNDELIRQYCNITEALLSRWNPDLPGREELEILMEELVRELRDLPEGTPHYPTAARWIVGKNWVPDHALARHMLEEALKVWEHHAIIVKNHRYGTIKADVQHWISREATRSGPSHLVASLTTGNYRETSLSARHFDIIRGNHAIRIARDISREFKSREAGTTRPACYSMPS